MEIFDGHRALFRPLVTPAVAVGNFDGLHIGHQRLVDEAVAAAGELGGDAVVYTFDPHPARVLAPDRAPPLICSRDRKLELIADRGVSVTILEPFTRELSQTEPDDFLRQVFVRVLGARCVVVGYDFTYGRRAAGTVDSLRAFGAAHDIDVRVIDAVEAGGAAASSSAVRAAIRDGDMARARALLGRDADVDGTVVEGERRGRELGFPTANVDYRAELMPPTGIYATWVQVLDGDDPGRKHAAATSLGTNPTFGADKPVTLEAHLLDFDGDLYGHRLRVGFIERLRGEVQYQGVDALVQQIEADCAQTRTIFERQSDV